MDCLPEEILEYILSLVSPYEELDQCKLVCRKWQFVASRVLHRRKNNLYNAFKENNLCWEFGESPTSTDRFMQAICYDGKSNLYMYGGHSSKNTTYNDLTMFNLTDRLWTRHFARGSLPSPKAGASLCEYEGRLILFGGFSPPSDLLPHQDRIIFDELHSFNMASGKWFRHPNRYANGDAKEPLCLHCVSVHDNQMITYGGIQKVAGSFSSLRMTVDSLDLDTMLWNKPRCSDGPHLMFPPSQIIYVDKYHLLIICAGPCFDGGTGRIWLLSMVQEPWTWTQVEEENPKWSPMKLHSVSMIRCEGSLIALCNEEQNKLSPVVPPTLGTCLYLADMKDVTETQRIRWREPQRSAGPYHSRDIARPSMLLTNTELVAFCCPSFHLSPYKLTFASAPYNPIR